MVATWLTMFAQTGHLPVVTNVADITDALDLPAVSERAFSVEGTISAYDPAGFVIADTTGRYAMRDEEQNFKWELGDIVRVYGRICRSVKDDNPRAIVERLAVCGHDTLPAPETVPPESIAFGNLNFHRVILSGVVIAVIPDEIDPKWLWLFLKTNSATIKICVKSGTFADMRPDRLVDAEATVIGTVLPPRGSRRFIGSRVYVESPQDIAIVLPPPSNPFQECENFKPNSTTAKRRKKFLHRQKTEGIVIATWHGDTFLLHSTAGDRIFVHLTVGESSPSPHDEVVVVGFPDSDAFSPHFMEARYIPTRLPVPQKELIPIRISDADLFSDEAGNQRLNVALNGQLVRISGIVREAPDTDSHERKMHVKCGRTMLSVDVGNVPWKRLPGIGDRIELVGACWMQFAAFNRATDFTRFKDVSIVLRSADDIRIIEKAPWMTPFRFLVISGAMILALVVVIVWNRMLRHIITRRSRELFKETIARASADLKVGERTRLAMELHDSVAQNLIGVSLQIAAAQRTWATDVSLRYLDTANRILQSCRTELRQCLWDLRCEALEEPDFEKAIRMTVQPVLAASKLTIRFNVPRAHLHDNTAHSVLRILRELVSNAVRHGKASDIRIAGEKYGDGIRFSVRDNGCGFVPEQSPDPSSGHFGLKGIRERLGQMNGSLSIESGPGVGTRIVISIPHPTWTKNQLQL